MNTKGGLLLIAWYKQNRHTQHRGFLIFKAVLNNRNEEVTFAEAQGAAFSELAHAIE